MSEAAPTHRLVAVLTARQQQLGLTDGRFARLMGLTRPLWQAIRTGRRNVSLRLLAGVVRAFPDLEGEALAFLRNHTEEETNG